jgi:N-carbamoyl-L-amino-acid hydrolase
VRITADVRDIDLARRDAVLRSVDAAGHEISAKRGVTIKTEVVNADAPAACAPELIKALESSCQTHNFGFKKMVSRAYHDSLFMSRVAPTVMLFIPCRNGYSHRPDEYASAEDIARGTLVLAETLAKLAS